MMLSLSVNVVEVCIYARWLWRSKARRLFRAYILLFYSAVCSNFWLPIWRGAERIFLFIENDTILKREVHWRRPSDMDSGRWYCLSFLIFSKILDKMVFSIMVSAGVAFPRNREKMEKIFHLVLIWYSVDLNWALKSLLSEITFW